MKKILEINDLKKLSKKNFLRCSMITLILVPILERHTKIMRMILKIKLKQRVGVNIKNRILSTKILGKKYNYPFGLAPVGMGMMYPNGEIVKLK